MVRKPEPKTSHAKAHAAEGMAVKRERYVEGIGRRKTAVARVRVTKGSGAAMINEKKVGDYFPLERLRETALSPLKELKVTGNYDVQVRVSGGGIHAQADAVRHGLARALVGINEELRHRLHVLGFLTRDPRMVERKKYGMKKARRAPQWKKR